MLSCPSCGEENEGDRQFCVTCGSPLPAGTSGVERYHLEGVLGGTAAVGFSTLSPGGALVSTSGCTAGNGSSPARPGLSGSVIIGWYQAGMNQYLAGAGGDSSPFVQGGSATNGLFIEASDHRRHHRLRRRRWSARPGAIIGRRWRRRGGHPCVRLEPDAG